MIELREGSPLNAPRSGPEPWVAVIVLRRTGGRVLPGLGGEEVLRVYELTPDVVAKLGGPEKIPDALEPDRRKYALGAIKAGITGWAVEVDVTRGHRRRLWSVPGGEHGAV